MNVLRGIRLRLLAGAGAGLAVLAAAGGATSVSADPSDAICIMDDASYCSLYEGHTVGTSAYRACLRRWAEAQAGEQCNPILP